MAKKLKVGVHRGGGPAPGYQWNVVILDMAFRDSMAFLAEDQYAHLAEQVRELAKEPDPSHSQTASIDVVEDFLELREKSGALGGMNVRLFFFLEHAAKALVVLGVIRKQNNGPTPVGDKIRMRRRKRLYLAGDLGTPQVGA